MVPSMDASRLYERSTCFLYFSILASDLCYTPFVSRELPIDYLWRFLKIKPQFVTPRKPLCHLVCFIPTLSFVYF